MRDVRTQLVVDRYESGLRFDGDSGLVQPEVPTRGPLADSDEQPLGPQFFGPGGTFDPEHHSLGGAGERERLRPDPNLDAQPFEGAGEFAHEVGFEAGEELGHELDDRDVHPHPGEEPSKLAAADPASQDEEGAGQRGQSEQHPPDVMTVVPSGSNPRRTRGTAPAATIANSKSMRSWPPSGALRSAECGPVKRASPLRTVTPADLRSEATPSRSFATTASFHRIVWGRSNWTSAARTPISGPSDRTAEVERCRVDERLRRDAAPVEALAAELVLLDQEDLEAELSSSDGGDVSARTPADDEHLR